MTKKERKIVLNQAWGIIIVPALLGLALNGGLVVRFLKGEFAPGFVAAAETGSIPSITIDQARELWLGRQAQFLDARSAGIFAAGHIPDAVNIPVNEPDWEGLVGRLSLDRARPTVTYCSGSSCLDGLHLALWLKAHQGFDDIRVFPGGWQEWVDGGWPIEASHDQK